MDEILTKPGAFAGSMPRLQMRDGYYQFMTSQAAAASGLILGAIGDDAESLLDATNAALRQIQDRMGMWLVFYDGYVASTRGGKLYLVAGIDGFIVDLGSRKGQPHRLTRLDRSPDSDGVFPCVVTRGVTFVGEIPKPLREALRENAKIEPC